jgi:Beta-propeller repeat
MAGTGRCLRRLGAKLNSRPQSADKVGMSGFPRPILRRTVPLLLSVALQLASQRVAMSAPSLPFASTLGGSQSETIRAIATDAAQNVYVVGETYSPDFPGPATSNSARRAGDAFVVKLNSSGTQILYSVVLSGAGYDSARGVAVDSSGNAYVTGVTTSADFPVTTGAFQRFSGSPGLEDAFVVKLSPAGALLYATYLGGSSSDLGYAIAIDPSGAAYVAGSTNSVNFPVTGSAPQRTFRGGSDCFVAKLDPSGAALSYSTYLGGESIDVCKGIAVDASGAAFVTGTTTSTLFPVTAALKQTLSGWSDAFLTKLSPAGDRLLFSTYLGAEGADDGNVVRVDSTGAVYIAGDTSSTGFPVTPGAMQRQYNGGYDGFVCGVANDGSRIVFSTYLGAAERMQLTISSSGRTAASWSPDTRRRWISRSCNPFRARLAGRSTRSWRCWARTG